MSQTIRQLWNGRLAPVRCSGIDNPEINESLKAIEECLSELNRVLGREEAALLESYRSQINEYVALCSEQAFCDGYSLGAKITAEALLAAGRG